MAPRLVSTYRLIESLGRGVKGEVFKAEDSRLQRLVALRILDREFLNDGQSGLDLRKIRYKVEMYRPE